MTDLISRADAIEAVRKEYEDAINIGDNGDAIAYDVGRILSALPSAEAVSREDYHNLLMASNDIDRALREYQAKEEQLSAEVAPKIDHDRDWIIGCIEHDGFIHTDRFDKANQIIHDALSAEAVQGWIPCSERLPKMREVTHYGETYRMSECVLVTGTLEYQDFDTYNTSIFVGNCFDDMNGTDIYWYQNEDRIINVTAWMPLPKQYKGGDTE